MKVSEKQFKAIKDFAKKHLSKNDPWHNLYHIKQTIKLSIVLAKKEKADVDKSVIIAWLHDISKRHQSKKTDHGTEAAKLAKPFLLKIGIEKNDVEDICHAIDQHNKGGKKKIKEASIIWDADKLQGVGAYGVIRNYGYFVNKGLNQERAYKEDIETQKFLSANFKTKTGRKIAAQDKKLMKAFYKNYKQRSGAKI